MCTGYLALNLHANTASFGWMDAEGTYRDENAFDTSTSRMISCVAVVPANEVICTFEEGPSAGWAARTLHQHVDKLIVCYPRENDSISEAIRMADDSPDTYGCVPPSIVSDRRRRQLTAAYAPQTSGFQRLS
jgi:hypothetical protein